MSIPRRYYITDADWSNASCPYGEVLRDEDTGRPLMCQSNIKLKRFFDTFFKNVPWMLQNK